MPSGRYTRIEITPEAYMGLEAEAIIQGKTLKRLASELILKGISQKALRFIHEELEPEDQDLACEDQEPCLDRARRPRLSENIEAISQIKQLWSRNPRPSQREIAKQIGYPASSAKYFIKKMLESGELEA
jgi:hypothetical protein